MELKRASLENTDVKSSTPEHILVKLVNFEDKKLFRCIDRNITVSTKVLEMRQSKRESIWQKIYSQQRSSQKTVE